MRSRCQPVGGRWLLILLAPLVCTGCASKEDPATHDTSSAQGDSGESGSSGGGEGTSEHGPGTSDDGDESGDDGGEDVDPPACHPGLWSTCVCSDGSFGKATCGDDFKWSACEGCGESGCLGDEPCDGSQFGCDLLGDDCPVDQKCMVQTGGPGWTPGFPTCVPPGSGTPGDTCTVSFNNPNTDDCDEKSYCDPWGGDACLPACEGSERNPSCPAGSSPDAICYWSGSQTSYNPVCKVPCDPLLATACPQGQACVALSSSVDDAAGFVGFVCISLASAGGPGDECTCANCCDAGLSCVPSAEYGPGCEADLCCTELCDATADPAACPENQRCLAMFPWSHPQRRAGHCVASP